VYYLARELCYCALKSGAKIKNYLRLKLTIIQRVCSWYSDKLHLCARCKYVGGLIVSEALAIETGLLRFAKRV